MKQLSLKLRWFIQKQSQAAIWISNATMIKFASAKDKGIQK